MPDIPHCYVLNEERNMNLLKSIFVIVTFQQTLAGNEVIELSFDSPLEDNGTIKIFPYPHDENLTALSICFRDKFKFWDSKDLFYSETISVEILDFKMLGGYVRVGEVFYHFRCQFHQHFMSSFFVGKSFEQLFCTYNLGLYLFGARKSAQKLLVKCW